MDLNKFVALFAEQFDDTPADVFNAATDYKALDEWGSLVALSVISMVDEEFEKRITGADIKKCTTIEDLYNLVLSK
ncbi:MAG: acyl carrier protein [Bacteroidales bacterium]|nr:acyl carrier protein [Bacteroidales bacterium]MBR6929733.1 acyl carrier protein [Bacteroidales bacterium]